MGATLYVTVVTSLWRVDARAFDRRLDRRAPLTPNPGDATGDWSPPVLR